MNFAAITLEDCEFLEFRYGFETIISNGEVVGFEKKDSLGPFDIIFCYVNRSKSY